MTTPRLPWDRARCHGLECEEREACLRFLTLDDMGLRTSQYENMCVSEMDNAKIEAIDD